MPAHRVTASPSRHGPTPTKASSMKAATMKPASAKAAPAAIKPAAAVIAGTAIEAAAVIALVVIAAVVVIAVSAQCSAHYAGDRTPDDRSRNVVTPELDLPNIGGSVDPLWAEQSCGGRNCREDQRNPDGSSTPDQHHPKSFRVR